MQLRQRTPLWSLVLKVLPTRLSEDAEKTEGGWVREKITHSVRPLPPEGPGAERDNPCIDFVKKGAREYLHESSKCVMT